MFVSMHVEITVCHMNLHSIQCPIDLSLHASQVRVYVTGAYVTHIDL